MKLRNVVPAVIAGVAVAGAIAKDAVAQVGTVTRQTVENFVGVSTDGSETGIYELVEMVETGVLVAFGLAVVVAGFMVGRKILRYVRGAG